MVLWRHTMHFRSLKVGKHLTLYLLFPAWRLLIDFSASFLSMPDGGVSMQCFKYGTSSSFYHLQVSTIVIPVPLMVVSGFTFLQTAARFYSSSCWQLFLTRHWKLAAIPRTAKKCWAISLSVLDTNRCLRHIGIQNYGLYPPNFNIRACASGPLPKKLEWSPVIIIAHLPIY